MNVVERSVVRAVVIDAGNRVLLFHTRDPIYPELDTWWELPGGGIEPGETYREAVVRELAEETGIAITPDQVGTPNPITADEFGANRLTSTRTRTAPTGPGTLSACLTGAMARTAGENDPAPAGSVLFCGPHWGR